MQWDGEERGLYVEQAMSANWRSPTVRGFMSYPGMETGFVRRYAPTDAASLVGLCDDPASFVSSTAATRLKGAPLTLYGTDMTRRDRPAPTLGGSHLCHERSGDRRRGLTSWTVASTTRVSKSGAVAGPYRFLRREASN